MLGLHRPLRATGAEIDHQSVAVLVVRDSQKTFCRDGTGQIHYDSQFAIRPMTDSNRFDQSGASHRIMRALGEPRARNI